MLEDIRSDLRAYDGNWAAQGFWAMLVYRFGRWRYGVKPTVIRKLFSFIYKLLFKLIQIITGIELPCEADVGRNFVIDHFGGIIVSGYAKFGDNCRIRNGVVVGLRRVDEKFAPVIGNNGPDDVGQGRLLPSTGVDQHAATLGRWFGVSDTDLLTVLPNLKNYGTRDLGFLN